MQSQIFTWKAFSDQILDNMPEKYLCTLNLHLSSDGANPTVVYAPIRKSHKQKIAQNIWIHSDWQTTDPKTQQDFSGGECFFPTYISTAQEM